MNPDPDGSEEATFWTNVREAVLGFFDNQRSLHRSFAQILRACDQTAPVRFASVLPPNITRIIKLSEGGFGDVYRLYLDTGESQVYKLMLLNYQNYSNYFANVSVSVPNALTELLISLRLRDLRTSARNRCDSFIDIHSCHLVHDNFPPEFVAARSQHSKGPALNSLNEYYYLILTMDYKGHPLRHTLKNMALSSQNCRSILQQLCCAIRVAELELQFEHRDLYTRNVLVDHTSDLEARFLIEGELRAVQTTGVKVTIIDFSLSRVTLQNGRACYTEIESCFKAYVIKKYISAWKNFHHESNLYFISKFPRKFEEALTNPLTRDDICLRIPFYSELFNFVPFCTCIGCLRERGPAWARWVERLGRKFTYTAVD